MADQRADRRRGPSGRLVPDCWQPSRRGDGRRRSSASCPRGASAAGRATLVRPRCSPSLLMVAQLRRHRRVHGESRQRVQVAQRPARLARDRRHLAVRRLHGRCGRRGDRRAAPHPQLPAGADARGRRGRGHGRGRRRSGRRRWTSRPSARRPDPKAGSLSAGTVVWLAVATAVLLTAAPYLVRPARRTRARHPGAGGARRGGRGRRAARIHRSARSGSAGRCRPSSSLVVGTPKATPTTEGGGRARWATSGSASSDLELADDQTWGETRFVGRDARRSPRLGRGDRPGRHRRPLLPQGLARRSCTGTRVRPSRSRARPSSSTAPTCS